MRRRRKNYIYFVIMKVSNPALMARTVCFEILPANSSLWFYLGCFVMMPVFYSVGQCVLQVSVM